MKPTWYDEALATYCGSVTNRLPGGAEDIRFLALSLAGEAGELANKVKKDWRGDDIPLAAILEEIADVRVILEYLTWALQPGATSDDIVEMYAMPKMRERWAKQ